MNNLWGIKQTITHTISVDNMAKAVVKSSQEIGSFTPRPKNSRTRMRKVTQKQKHQVNMHHVQKEYQLWPTDATRLKEMQVKISSSKRTMPTGAVSVLKSSATMVTQVLWLELNTCSPAPFILLIFCQSKPLVLLRLPKCVTHG